jgi:hypothetical protein
MELKLTHTVVRLDKADECYHSEIVATDKDNNVIGVYAYGYTYGTECFATGKNMELALRGLKDKGVTSVIVYTHSTEFAKLLTTLEDAEPRTLKASIRNTLKVFGIELKAVRLT